MAIGIRWASTGQRRDLGSDDHHERPDLDRLLAEWQAAPSKADYISKLDLHTAGLLCSHIWQHIPPLPKKPKGKLMQLTAERLQQIWQALPESDRRGFVGSLSSEAAKALIALEPELQPSAAEQYIKRTYARPDQKATK